MSLVLPVVDIFEFSIIEFCVVSYLTHRQCLCISILSPFISHFAFITVAGYLFFLKYGYFLCFVHIICGLNGLAIFNFTVNTVYKNIFYTFRYSLDIYEAQRALYGRQKKNILKKQNFSKFMVNLVWIRNQPHAYRFESLDLL